MDEKELRKKFPAYMDSIQLPDCAKEQEIVVYRACPTRKIEKASFLNSYEENGFETLTGIPEDDPQQYCLSTFEKVKDLKRFVEIDGKYNPPMLLAKGITAPECGISCRTREWKPKQRSSHVDWWLYEDAEPWKHFKEADYDEEREREIQNRKT